MHHLAVLPPLLPAVYLMKADLHPLCRPAHITRLGNRVLVQIHFASLMAEWAMWIRENMTDSERTAMRLAFGVDPDLRVPFDDRLLEGYVIDAVFPKSLEVVAEPHASMSIAGALRSG